MHKVDRQGNRQLRSGFPRLTSATTAGTAIQAARPVLSKTCVALAVAAERELKRRDSVSSLVVGMQHAGRSPSVLEGRVLACA